MDHQDHQELIPQPNLRSPNSHHIIHTSKYLIWSFQFLVSLSILSLFISYLTGISLSYSYTYYFSTFFLPLLTRALERNYVFLTCNGIILTFLVGFRGLHDHHPHFQDFDLNITENYERFDDYGLDTIESSLETEVSVLEDQSRHDIIRETSLEHEVEEEKEQEGERDEFDGSNLMAEDEDPNKLKEEKEEVEEGGGGDEKGRRDDDENEGDEKGLVRSISGCTDDELNKKFDEFIRKMKEELRLEAKEYQLIPA